MSNDQDILSEPSPPSEEEPVSQAAGSGNDQPEGPEPSPDSDPEAALSTGDLAADTALPSPSHNIAEIAENQDKTANVEPVSNLALRIEKRRSEIEGLMVEKELRALTYAEHKVPKPYYEAWKSDANELFRLLVSLKQRQPRRKRAG